MRLNNLKLKSKVFLAPLEGVNDIAFRILCKKAGAGLVWSGMINPMTREKLQLNDKPVIQLFSNNKNGIKEFMKKNNKNAVAWDFNLGCPMDRARKAGVGAYLTDLNVIEGIIQEMRNNIKKPLFLKIRKSDISFDLLKIAEKYCDAIIIHARTREQGYSGKSDVEFALEIKKKSKIPVIYSGDADENNAPDLLKKFDYVMIGRAALGNPNVFNLKNIKKKFSFKDYLKLAEKYGLGFNQIKTQAIYFTKGMKNAGKMRKEITKTHNLEDLKKIFC